MATPRPSGASPPSGSSLPLVPSPSSSSSLRPRRRSSRPRHRRAVVERRCRARWCSRPRPGGRAAGHSDAASRVWEEEQQGMTAQQATVGLRRASRDEGAVHSGNDGGTTPEKKTKGGRKKREERMTCGPYTSATSSHIHVFKPTQGTGSDLSLSIKHEMGPTQPKKTRSGPTHPTWS